MDSPSAPEQTTKSVKRKPAATKGRNKSAAEKKLIAARGGDSKKDVVEKIPEDEGASTLEDRQVGQEEKMSTSTDHVNIILSKLGSDLQQRMQAKRQRLESCFNAVKLTPNEIIQTFSSQAEDRKKMIEGFHADSQKVMKDVANVLSLQAATEDKFSKMLTAMNKQFEHVKDALKGTVTSLNDAVDKFVKDTDTLEEKHSDESKIQLQKIQQDLASLQKKILLDGQQEEAANIKSSLQLV